MDFFRKERLVFWCVIVLMLLNVALVATFWVKRPPFRPPGPGGNHEGGLVMQKQLQLSEEQIHLFEQIRHEHFTRADPLEEHVHEIRLALLNEIFATEPNEATIVAMCAEIGQTQSQFDRELFNHFRELKQACTHSQMTTLKRMLTEIIESSRPRDPRSQPPGPGVDAGPG